MSEEEKIKKAIDLAIQGIDLEETEKKLLEICDFFVELAKKNKKIIDKYCRRKDKEDEERSK